MKAKKFHFGSKNKYFPYDEHRRLQYGIRPQMGWESNWKCRLYQSVRPFSNWDPNSTSLSGLPASHRLQALLDDDDAIMANPAGFGGVFNLEFSPDGRLLAAACQNKAVVLFDPLTHRQTSAIHAAHTDCVNAIRFLDERLFASCSDDQTVALWDVRNLRQRVHSLRGHTKWVKNVEYHARDGLIITSGFDGDVIAWDINRPCGDGDGVHHERLFRQQGLMRMRLSPDLRKLLLCTSAGYMLLLQNLDIENFQRDMKYFKQLSGDDRDAERLVVGRKRNRPIIIRDFPATNRAEIIHSMQVHPQSWAVLSRNTSKHDESEWTCVHDIQEFQADLESSEPVADEEQPSSSKGSGGGGSLPNTLPSPYGEDELDIHDNHHHHLMDQDDDAPAQDGDASGGPRGYYILGEESATPRFRMLLDNRGGNWLDMAAATRQDGRGRGRVRGENNNEADEEDDEDDDDDSDEGNDEDARPRGIRGPAPAAGDESDENANDYDDDLDFDAENTRQRAMMLGLNILIQRNAASVFSELRALGIGPHEEGVAGGEEEALADGRERRRRGARGRAGQVPHLGASPRDRIERHNQQYRNRWRVSRRLSQISQRFRDQRNRLALNNNSASGASDRRDISDEPSLAAPSAQRGGTTQRNNSNDDREPGSARVGGTSRAPREPGDGRTWNELRNDEIRRTLRSLRSGLDMVMANLNSVRRQIDNDVGRGLNLDMEPLFLPRTNNCVRMLPNFHTNYLSADPVVRRCYAQQRPRLTHYISEPNVGRGFIKELCFSSDGRLVCSPYMYGLRLLAFDSQCSEMSHCVSDKARPLTEIAQIKNCHNKSVVSTKFSPTHTLLVSGCLGGKITWHQPVL